MHKIIALSALRKTGAKRSEKRRVIQRILTHMSEDFSGCGTRIRTLVMTESESVALPLGDAALLTNAPHYSRFPRACQELLKKITEFSVNYRNSHHLREWGVAEMPGQCTGAWAEKPTPLLCVPD